MDILSYQNHIDTEAYRLLLEEEKYLKSEVTALKSKKIDLNEQEYTHQRKRKAKEKSVQKELEKYAIEESPTISNKRSKNLYDYSSAKWITRLEITNFKNIQNMVLEFPTGLSEPIEVNKDLGKIIQDNIQSLPILEIIESQPWMVLLGENGVGKSSILQAIYLTLKGEVFSNNLCQELELSPKGFINRPKKGKTATIKVFVSNQTDPITLTISDNDKEDKIHIVPKKIDINLLGYGSMRLLPRKRSLFKTNTNDQYLDNISLFDPYSSLNDGEAWLANPKKVNSKAFKRYCEVIPILLDIDSLTPIQRRKGKLKIKFGVSF